MDDNPSNAIILVKLLQHCGYDAVFELGGDAAFKTLTKHSSSGRPKVVSLTGYPRRKGHGDDSLFDEYLLKPVDVKTLRRVMEDGH